MDSRAVTTQSGSLGLITANSRLRLVIYVVGHHLTPFIQQYDLAQPTTETQARVYQNGAKVKPQPLHDAIYVIRGLTWWRARGLYHTVTDSRIPAFTVVITLFLLILARMSSKTRSSLGRKERSYLTSLGRAKLAELPAHFSWHRV